MRASSLSVREKIAADARCRLAFLLRLNLCSYSNISCILLLLQFNKYCNRGFSKNQLVSVTNNQNKYKQKNNNINNNYHQPLIDNTNFPFQQPTLPPPLHPIKRKAGRPPKDPLSRHTPIRNNNSTTFARKPTVIPKPPATSLSSSSSPTLLLSSSIGNNITNHHFSTTPTIRAPYTLAATATTTTTTTTVFNIQTKTATQAIHKSTPIPQKPPTILRPITQPQCSNNNSNSNSNSYILATNTSTPPKPPPSSTMIKSINMGIIDSVGGGGGVDGGDVEGSSGFGDKYNSKSQMVAVTNTGNGGVKYNINNNNYAVNSFVDEFTDFVLNDRFADELTTNNYSSHSQTTSKPMKNCEHFMQSRTIAGAQGGSTIVRNANNTVITPTNSSNNNKKTTIQPRTVQLLVTRRPIIANNNASSNSTQIVANNSSAGASQTATIVGPGVLKITSAPTHANHNNNNQILHTSAGTETVVIEEEDDELLTATSGDDGSMSPSALAMSATTAQILRKFRIPKGTALTAKSISTVEVATSAPEALICSASTSPVHSPINSTSCSPPPPADTPNSVDLVEEVIETDENSTCGPTEEALITADTTTADTINDCEVDAVEEHDIDANTNNTTTVLVPANSGSSALTATTATALPQIQLQTVQPNGTVTCINLPPNTILLTAPDGSTILATATPQQLSKLTQHQQPQPQPPQPPQPQQQQIIAIQDWHGGSGGAGASNSNSSVDGNTATVLQAVQAAATHHQQQTATTTQTLLLTADGTAIPIIQSAPSAATSANSATSNSAAAAAAAAAQIVAAQQAEALKAQVLA